MGYSTHRRRNSKQCSSALHRDAQDSQFSTTAPCCPYDRAVSLISKPKPKRNFFSKVTSFVQKTVRRCSKSGRRSSQPSCTQPRKHLVTSCPFDVDCTSSRTPRVQSCKGPPSTQTTGNKNNRSPCENQNHSSFSHVDCTSSKTPFRVPSSKGSLCSQTGGYNSSQGSLCTQTTGNQNSTDPCDEDCQTSSPCPQIGGRQSSKSFSSAGRRISRSKMDKEESRQRFVCCNNDAKRSSSNSVASGRRSIKTPSYGSDAACKSSRSSSRGEARGSKSSSKSSNSRGGARGRYKHPCCGRSCTNSVERGRTSRVPSSAKTGRYHILKQPSCAQRQDLDVMYGSTNVLTTFLGCLDSNSSLYCGRNDECDDTEEIQSIFLNNLTLSDDVMEPSCQSSKVKVCRSSKASGQGASGSGVQSETPAPFEYYGEPSEKWGSLYYGSTSCQKP